MTKRAITFYWSRGIWPRTGQALCYHALRMFRLHVLLNFINVHLKQIRKRYFKPININEIFYIFGNKYSKYECKAHGYFLSCIF